MTDQAATEDGVNPPVVYEVENGIATLTLNRPDERNVMNVETMQALHRGLLQARSDDNVRVVVITGSGNTFCAGADLKGASTSSADGEQWSGPKAIVHVLEAILECPKPTVARVQGHVAGGGNGLIAACDLSVAVDTARFAFSEVRLGLAPAVISVVCLARMNVADGYELFLTGERVSAQRMKEAGMLNYVVAADGLDGAVTGLTDQLRLGGPQALAATRELLRNVRTLSRSDAFEWTSDMSTRLFGSAEAAAGMNAFLNKQSPPWVASS